mgnify:CR=1 FL=1
MNSRFIVCNDDAVDIHHVAALESDEYGRHVVIMDFGAVLGVTDEMHRRILAAITRNYN